MAQTLSELKAQNAQAEEQQKDENAAPEEDTSTPPQADEDESESEAAEDETETDDEDAETSETGEGESDAEDWMQGDGHESPGDKKFTDSDIGKAKAKLRAKLEKRHQEDVEKLQRENEELRQQLQGSGAKRIEKPKREAFDDADDPEDAYLEALADWRFETKQAEQQARQQTQQAKQQQEEFRANVEKQVDQHYERAVKLADKSGITAETYQEADRRFRQVFEDIFPETGDVIADALIANIGDGSEKVTYKIGIHSATREEFKRLLLEDRTGIKAGIYLGKLAEKLTAPSKRTSTAPTPAPDLQGDKNASGQSKALKKRYTEARNKGDTQAAYDARKAARKAGVDTSDW